MEIPRDPLMEQARTLAAIEQAAFGHRRATQAQLLAAVREKLSIDATEALGADLSRSMAPPLVGAGERPIVRIPHGDSPRVEPAGQFLTDGALPPISSVHGVVEPRELVHRNRVETEAISHRGNRPREGGEHLMLPAEVLPLSRTVPDAKCDVVLGDPAQGTVSEDAAEDELLLIGGHRVALDGDEHLIACADLRCRPLATRSENEVVRRAGELPTPRPSGGLDLEAEPLVGLSVLEVSGDPPRRDLAGSGVQRHDLDR